MRSNRNLRLLVAGQFFSAIGDHFYLVAMPWLALQVSGSAFVAGTLLAVASLPRAAFMLVGGAVTDRHSAKMLLILSNGIQAVLMAGLAFALGIAFTELWFLYALAFLTGMIDAFGLPAFNTILPLIVEPDDLERGNVYLQGANMASGALGPALAGLLIFQSSSGNGSAASLQGLAFAFLANALTFLIGISFFWWIRTKAGKDGKGVGRVSILASIGAVLTYIRNDRQLRTLFMINGLLGLVLTGCIRIGFPMLAELNPGAGVRDFGYMSSAFGAGLLAGMAALRLLPRPPAKISGVIVLVLFSAVPSGLILLGLMLPIYAVLIVILAMGAAFGYVLIYLLSWLQRRTPTPLLGRMMAVVLFSSIGMAPISQTLMGFLLDVSVRWTFIGAGSLTLGILAILGTNREMWALRTDRHDQWAHFAVGGNGS